MDRRRKEMKRERNEIERGGGKRDVRRGGEEDLKNLAPEFGKEK